MPDIVKQVLGRHFNTLQIHRREALRAAVGGLLGVSSSGWLPRLAAATTESGRKRHCVLLWMSGGPSQLDTFDMKPQHANGGEFKESATSVPGLRFSEHLPNLARLADHLAVVRSVSTSEGDHARGTYLMRTGQRPGSPVQYPTIGSALAKELGQRTTLPDYVSINPSPEINPDAFGPGILGPQYAATTVGERRFDATDESTDRPVDLRVDNLLLPPSVTATRVDKRRQLWESLQRGFLDSHASGAGLSQDTVFRKALDLMTSKDVEAFDLTKEPDSVRQAYGPGRFNQGCLIARRLIERGVSFVEVTLGNGLGWDTHQNNFPQVRRLSEELDRGWSALMIDLQRLGLLENTTLLWIGEFGRTPQVNGMRGRDHFPDAWTCVFAGGGIAGGQAHGKTAQDGSAVVDGKVNQADILATLCQAVGVDPATENVSPEGRPIKISDGKPIAPILS
jgi:hypothetical protein